MNTPAFNSSEAELWKRLQAFKVGTDNDAFGFLDRLARENHWSDSFTRRVFEEYRRFLFLAATSSVSVTPSQAVDEAWHLHLCYTRSYWDELCQSVLQKPVHHGPTKGGKEESRKYFQAYTETLARYRETFCEEPPSDIWPPPEKRFDRSERVVKVSCRRAFVLPKKPLYTIGGLVIGALLLTGCERVIKDALTGDVPSIVFVVLSMLFFIVVFRVLFGGRRKKKGSRNRKNGGDSGVWFGSDGGGSDGGDSGCGGGCGGCGD